MLKLLVNKNFKIFIKVFVFDVLVVRVGICCLFVVYIVFICFLGLCYNILRKKYVRVKECM